MFSFFALSVDRKSWTGGIYLFDHMSGIQHLVNKESNWSLIHYKNILLELSSSSGRHFKMLINSCLIVTSWLVLYPHLGKAALDIGTWNELCWKMAHRQIISFERPNLWLAAIKKIGLSKYNNKPLQNTNKNKPDHSFFFVDAVIRRGAWYVIANAFLVSIRCWRHLLTDPL